MPSYGSLHSPSLRKMNGHIDNTSRRRTSGMSAMNMAYIIGDPFALATVSIAMVSFLPLSLTVYCIRNCTCANTSQIVGLVNRIHFLNRCSDSVPFPQLLLVDCRVYAFLHHWRLRGYCVQHNRDISRGYCWFPSSRPCPYYVIRQFTRLLSRRCERSSSSWSHSALYGIRKFCLLGNTHGIEAKIKS